MQTAITLTDEYDSHSETNLVLYNHKEISWNRYHLFVALGLGGGLVAGLFGFLLTIIAWFGANEHFTAMHTLGTLLIVVTIPLLILGSHGLDGLERIKKEHH